MRDAQRMSPAPVMRDPYILDFLGLRDTWQKGDLEAAIIREMELFLLELGTGLSFVVRHKRIRLTTRISTSTRCSTTASCGGWVAVELQVGEFVIDQLQSMTAPAAN